MRFVFGVLSLVFLGTPVAAAVVEFNEFSSGTLISDDYSDFVVDLIGTDEEASILFSTYQDESPKTVLVNNREDDSVGHNFSITFESLVENVILDYTAVNFPGGAEITTESGTTFQAMQSQGCRINRCTADFSSYGAISSMLFIFEGVVEGELFEEVWNIERLSYNFVSDSSGGGDRPSEIPLPSAGFLLFGAPLLLGITK